MEIYRLERSRDSESNIHSGCNHCTTLSVAHQIMPNSHFKMESIILCATFTHILY